MTELATDDRLVVRTHEAARLLDVSPRSVRRLLERGELRSVLVGGSRRIATAELRRYLEEQRDR